MLEVACQRSCLTTKDVCPTVTKQSTYGDNDTALTVMHPVIKFYQLLHNTIEVEKITRDTENKLSNGVDPFHLFRHRTFPHQCDGVSWNATLKNLDLVMRCINGDVGASDSQPLEKLILAAFRDLSVLKDSKMAMGVFRHLQRICFPQGDMGHIIWARRIKERRDDSAVIVLHVSDYRRFIGIIKSDGNVDLEGGVFDMR